MRVQLKLLSKMDLAGIVSLASELHSTIPPALIKQRAIEMFEYNHYRCFGIYDDSKLVAMSNTWITTKFYSGKQLEIDNFIVSKKERSKGLGQQLIKFIENWALENDCVTVELNTYVENGRSHKFYFNQGFKILGFHFQKNLP